MSLDVRTPGGHGGDGHAVVIGSGLAGLTAAQALSHCLAKVTVVERDRTGRAPRPAGRCAQARTCVTDCCHWAAAMELQPTPIRSVHDKRGATGLLRRAVAAQGEAARV